MKAVIGLSIYMDMDGWLSDYWSSEVTFLHMVDEQEVNIDKMDIKAEYWH